MKITIVGGGSYCWTARLFRDILVTPELEGAEVVLEDINPKHLRDLHACCKVILKQSRKAKKFKLTATTNEREALKGANYVVLTITVGGYDTMEQDLIIPYKYGIWQPVGDTIGPGGLSRSLRNIPVVVGIAKNMERVCPDAWLLNITNPMTCITRAVTRETSIRCIGLCHELYGALGMLSRLLGISNWRRELECKSVGVNHFPWIIELKRNGKDAFPMIREKLRELRRRKAALKSDVKGTAFDASLVDRNQVKFQLFECFGALPAAGDRHLVEFFPYFITQKTNKGGTYGVKLTTIEDRRDGFTPAWKREVFDITKGKKKLEMKASLEALAPVMMALEGHHQWKDILNIPNRGQVPELPYGAVVETLGIVEKNAAYGLPVGKVPPGVLTQLQRHVANQEMTVEAGVKGDRGLALQALLNDPMCGTLQDARDAEKMLNELLYANRAWLPQFFNKTRRTAKRTRKA